MTNIILYCKTFSETSESVLALWKKCFKFLKRNRATQRIGENELKAKFQGF